MKIDKALKSTFRPEFINRIDEIIMFTKLTLDEMEQIVDLQLKELQSRLLENGVALELDPEARKWLASIGYDPAFGARPLRRALQKYIESPLSNLWLSDSLVPGDTVYVSHEPDSEKLNLEVKKALSDTGEKPAGMLEAPSGSDSEPSAE